MQDCVMMSAPTDEQSEYKHKTVLTSIGLSLEEMGVSNELHTVNEIAEKARLHHRTVKKSVEYIYYVQHFVPEIDIINAENKILVKIKDLPKYIQQLTEPRHLILVKLFFSKAYFGKRVPISTLNLSHDKIGLLHKMTEWINIDDDAGTIGLSIEGSKYAFNLTEEVTSIRDLSIVNLKDGTTKLREMSELIQPKKEEPDIEEFVAAVKAIGVENVQNDHNLLKEIQPVLDRIEHAQSTLNEAKSVLYKQYWPTRPNEIIRR